ncbi:MAG: hypothetical protein CM1200mP37_3100 [Chloroflexota bacterium]|nr:MAG: hypothetical protein CM1200mP37_3100 [Chloroflexota bacterium]
MRLVIYLHPQNPVLTWNERVEIYDNSIDEFPYLANYPRVKAVESNVVVLAVYKMTMILNLF